MSDEPTQTLDEREGLPSASGMEQLALCPGSWRAQQQCQPPPESEDAMQGTRLHECMEHHTPPEDAAEAEACMWCSEMEALLVSSLFTIEDGLPTSVRERRLWDKEHSFSGKADVIYIAGSRALILDYKFGRNVVADASCNWQLATLAVVVSDNYPQVQTIYAGVLQPHASRRKPQLVQYSPDNISTARAYIETAISKAQAANAPLRAGEVQCRYCRAAVTCPAALRTGQALSVADFRSWDDLAPARKRELWDEWKACERGGKKLADAVRRDLEAGVEIPGLALSSGKKMFEVSDPGKTYGLLAGELGITGEEYTACCKVGISGLGKLVHAKLKEGNEKQTTTQSRDWLHERLESWGCGKLSITKGSIEAKGGAK